MPTKQQLYDAIERLPDSEISAALRYLEFLSADPALFPLLTAPYDDEPYPDHQRARDAATIAGIDRAEKSLTSEELARDLGL